MSNEERGLLDSMGTEVRAIHSFTERERVVIESLIRKSLVSKVAKNNMILVVANESYKS